MRVSGVDKKSPAKRKQTLLRSNLPGKTGPRQPSGVNNSRSMQRCFVYAL
jgi:hypothetical protein